MTIGSIVGCIMLSDRLASAKASILDLQTDVVRLKKHQLALQEATVKIADKLSTEIQGQLSDADQRLRKAEGNLSEVSRRVGDARMVRDSDTQAVVWE